MPYFFFWKKGGSTPRQSSKSLWVLQLFHSRTDWHSHIVTNVKQWVINMFSEITCGLPQHRYSIRNTPWKGMRVLFIGNSQYSRSSCVFQDLKNNFGFYVTYRGWISAPVKGIQQCGGDVGVCLYSQRYLVTDALIDTSGIQEPSNVLKDMRNFIWTKVLNCLKFQKIHYEKMFWTRFFDMQQYIVVLLLKYTIEKHTCFMN